MKAVVTQLAARTWEQLRQEPAEWWLWVDTTGHGVHREQRLPTEPTQITHVWGWGPDWALRARVDVDLGEQGLGVCGARLRWSGSPVPAEEGSAQRMDVDEVIRPVWSLTYGGASMPAVPRLADEEGSRDLVTWEVHVEIDGPFGIDYVPLTFVRD